MHHHQNIHRHTIRHLHHNINLNITDRPTMVTMVIMDIMDIKVITFILGTDIFPALWASVLRWLKCRMQEVKSE